ncbi:glutathione S-transferase [Aliiruegeria haliotis]|uniref:Glutathione S-transferase n=1 Tax=Aliiruegeria haliotis TaxID=1280846 RepID=A0A2T0RQX9_9RHOB|nr:glutathione S-transferase [Aliiruegeria haliotis]PRY23578.1 glutathione S-transferase [Aliiruegeria haliotis]
MTYQLHIGDYTYSSWSLRGWLLFDRFGLPVRTSFVDFNKGSVASQMAALPPARTVPTLETADGTVIWDSLAIAEELASRHPEAGHWPSDPAARAIARSLAAEMHSGFMALRSDCPMNLRTAYSDAAPSEAVLADLKRLEEIWAFARDATQPKGPWLCGEYSAADAFFAPVAARIAGYSLPVSDRACAYVEAHLADPSFRRWRALGLVLGGHLSRYDQPHPTMAWPAVATLPARAVKNGPSVNAACIFSGKPVTHFAEVNGIVIGLCNPTCRDKVVADAAAWPAVCDLLGIN